MGTDSQGKTMGHKLSLKELRGALGPGPGGYDFDKQKRNNVHYT